MVRFWQQIEMHYILLMGRIIIHKSLLTTLSADRQLLHCITEIAESPVLLFPIFKIKTGDTVVVTG